MLEILTLFSTDKVRKGPVKLKKRYQPKGRDEPIGILSTTTIATQVPTKRAWQNSHVVYVFNQHDASAIK